MESTIGDSAILAPETSLDPTDWQDFQSLCESELSALISHLSGATDRVAWRAVPEDVKRSLAEPLPMEPQGPRQACESIRKNILPWTLGNTHPRFFGWVHGSGTPGGMLAEMYAAAINANLGGREHAPVYVERTVIDWCRQIFSFPDSASGLLLSGTSMANLVALAVARQHHAPIDIREEGVAALPQPMIAYTSAEAHCSVAKAMETLGLGRRNLRRIATNQNLQIDLDSLRQTIKTDRARGLLPFCVIGSAGTVNSAAIDDLAALANLCEQEQLWFHVDGAFGALAMLSEIEQPKLRGIERADSLAFDFHKWMHVPYDAGCLLVRDGEKHRQAFNTQANYLAEGLAASAGAPWYCEFGPELSRGFRALKVWFTIKEHGLRRLGRKIGDNCRQARYLAQQIESSPSLELLAPVQLNIVCFRYKPPGFPTSQLDRLNIELVAAIQSSGVAVPSSTRINERVAVRVNLTNHRTRKEDLLEFLNAALRLGPSVAERVLASDSGAPM
ncbi:aminotransferase class V-fold PLP-dependent enzyme [Roseiconus nitratireducens]|uniref:Aminotransferase class V-fold PLP-dependent enzyme n=2 Tax=Roseiconus nitratireducens TaxID=2605748 RepID=A0A5M6CZB6_9BACT|nr:aminotransferase class V-fold PLP-dependent enzyme [Roseiconus nitratireducens]